MSQLYDDRHRITQVVLFYRDFRGFSGGHLKVWHYCQHLEHSPNFRPTIFFSKESIWTPDNPWFTDESQRATVWNPQEADILFLAGTDWLMLAKQGYPPAHVPVVNLIQGVRHADPSDIRFSFLGRKAVRIGVSDEVTRRLYETRQVNGPIFTIPNGLAPEEMPQPAIDEERDIAVFIAGLKNPALAEKLASLLRQYGIVAQLQVCPWPRLQFLETLGRSRVAVLLPHAAEGFYLPALEGMALGALVICPDCIGNRSFCKDRYNCVMPPYSLDGIGQATLKACSAADKERHELLAAARQTVAEHSLLRERERFIEIMENLDQIW